MINHDALAKMQTKAMVAGGYIAALLILTTPFSTASIFILSFALLLVWILSSQFMKLPSLLRDNYMALALFLLLLSLIVSMSYTSASFYEAKAMVLKYRKWLVLIVLLPFLESETAQKWGWRALITATLANLIISYLFYFGILDPPHPILSPYSLKSRITHSLFISFCAFYCGHKALEPSKYRYLFLGLLLLSVHNLFVVVTGRTGQLIFLLLMMLLSYQRLSLKYFIRSMGLLMLTLALFVSFSNIADRAFEGISNTSNYLKADSGQESHSSMGQRLTFWENSIRLIKQKPWFGHGVGSFEQAYNAVADKEDFPSRNPHNEYLMLLAQQGVFGLSLFLLFLYYQYRYAIQMPSLKGYLAQGMLLTLVVNSLFNSSFLDHTEGHWFAEMIALCFAPLLRPEKS